MLYGNPYRADGQAPPRSTNTSSEPLSACPAPAAVPAGSQPPNDQQGSNPQIWLVTGPAGSGKSTVAKYLALSLTCPYIEGDDFHPKANIDKMSAGIPLTDADRWDWLIALREESTRQIRVGNNGVVVTCSALKRKYRDVIRVAPYFNSGVQLHFIYLSATEDMVLQRVIARQNHYMGANMVRSQFDILEPPTADELDVINIDVSYTLEEVMSDALVKVLQIISLNKER